MSKIRLDREYKVHQEVMKRLPLTGCLVTDEVERNGRTLYLVGESHNSGDAINYVHNQIVPRIKSSQENWMMLREGLGSYSSNSDEELLNSNPGFLYFRKLPIFLGIPVDDPVGSITSNRMQNLVASNSDVKVEEARGWYITNFIEANRGLMLSQDELRKSCAKRLSISLDELDEASKYAYSREVHERLMVAWNKVARKELDRILEENSNRNNVLVSVGVAHLPAFSDAHTYIG